MGWGKGKGHHAAVVAAEAALVGGAVVGTAAVAAAASRPRPARRTEVVVVQGAPAPSAAAPLVVVPSKGKGKRKGKGKGKGKWKSAVEIPALRIAAIGIPASSIERQAGVTFFGIDVLAEGAAVPYQVRRRYREFDLLRANLHLLAPSATINSDFPPKHRFFGCEGERLEADGKASCPGTMAEAVLTWVHGGKGNDNFMSALGQR
ncbi:unnamed protein product [Symbiodinium sp. CCMP2592]|nr:unnamed protein product [Symbiodinium sp. CCMP2592]